MINQTITCDHCGATTNSKGIALPYKLSRPGAKIIPDYVHGCSKEHLALGVAKALGIAINAPTRTPDKPNVSIVEIVALAWFGATHRDADPAVRASAKTFVEPAERVINALVNASHDMPTDEQIESASYDIGNADGEMNQGAAGRRVAGLFRPIVAALQAKNAELEQTRGELCDLCGWAMKFPGEPCRCELVKKLSTTEDKIALEGLGEECDDLKARIADLEKQIEDLDAERLKAIKERKRAEAKVRAWETRTGETDPRIVEARLDAPKALRSVRERLRAHTFEGQIRCCDMEDIVGLEIAKLDNGAAK